MKKTSAIGNTVPSSVPGPGMSPDDLAALAQVGVFTESPERSGTLIVRNLESPYIRQVEKNFELLPIAEALEKYEWLRNKFSWKAVPKDFDEITETCAKQKPVGYFLRVYRGRKVQLPCQTALYMEQENLSQIVHNVVILEDGSELQLITGCVSGPHISSGRHLSIDEQFVGKNAKLVSTMVHSWSRSVSVYPRAGTIVDDGGRFESSYISLKPPHKIDSVPLTQLNGNGASAKLLTIILADEGTVIDIGGNVMLNGTDTSAELMHRGVCTGGELHQKGLVIGNAKCRGHVDCAGMLLHPGENGYIESVPGIKALHPDAQLSHEASIGKIAPEQVEYLESRGMEEQEAISLLIRGFLGAGAENLGPELDSRIAEIAELAGHGEN